MPPPGRCSCPPSSESAPQTCGGEGSAPLLPLYRAQGRKYNARGCQQLGDGAEDPRYIQTRWGIGYRFVAPR